MSLPGNKRPEFPTNSNPDIEVLTCKWASCDHWFPNQNVLYAHICERHVGRKKDNNLELSCQWEGCDYEAAKRDHITSHVRSHCRELITYVCQACGEQFKRHQEWRKHSLRMGHQTAAAPTNAPITATTAAPVTTTAAAPVTAPATVPVMRVPQKLPALASMQTVFSPDPASSCTAEGGASADKPTFCGPNLTRTAKPLTSKEYDELVKYHLTTPGGSSYADSVPGKKRPFQEGNAAEPGKPAKRHKNKSPATELHSGSSITVGNDTMVNNGFSTNLNVLSSDNADPTSGGSSLSRKAGYSTGASITSHDNPNLKSGGSGLSRNTNDYSTPAQYRKDPAPMHHQVPARPSLIRSLLSNIESSNAEGIKTTVGSAYGWANRPYRAAIQADLPNAWLPPQKSEEEKHQERMAWLLLRVHEKKQEQQKKCKEQGKEMEVEVEEKKVEDKKKGDQQDQQEEIWGYELGSE